MSLTPGTRIGAYEITGRIGTGGMGDVYRAVDSNLGRHVAVKVLPDTFANDADRVARFEREAKIFTFVSIVFFVVSVLHGCESFCLGVIEGLIRPGEIESR